MHQDHVDRRLREAVVLASPEARQAMERDAGILREYRVDTGASLVEILRDRSHPVQMRAIAAWEAGLSHEAAFVAFLKDLVSPAESPEVLWEVAKALAALQYKGSAFRGLLAASRTEEHRATAIYASGLLGDAGATEELRRVLADVSQGPKLRGYAAEALGLVGGTEDVQALLQAMTDANPEVRYWAIFSLGNIGDLRAEAALKVASMSDRADVDGLGSIAEEAAEALQTLRHRIEEKPR